ncbi:MAG TPA: hypothetical protein VHC42_05410 [Rhizomicrobium sp.]|nr:hypothetical protein [Rhizomicrobium sp.]
MQYIYDAAEQELALAQARFTELSWSPQRDGVLRAAKSARDAAVVRRDEARNNLTAARKDLGAIEARELALSVATGEEMEGARGALEVASRDLDKCRRLRAEMLDRRAKIQKQLLQANERRKLCLLPAADGDVAAAKSLKTANSDRDDATDALELVEATLGEIDRRIEACEHSVGDSMVRALCHAAIENGRRRMEAAAQFESQFAALLETFDAMRGSARTAAEMFSIGQRIPEFAAVAQIATALSRQFQNDDKGFAIFVLSRLPAEVFSYINEPRRAPEQFASTERGLWSELHEKVK